METHEFEELVQQGILAIPKQFREKLDNVVIVTQLYPSFAQRKKMDLQRGWTLFGLYEGVPQTKRGQSYFGVLPDRITIFQGPIEDRAATPEDIKRIVTHTVWHEIAHHFGMSEKEVRAAEAERDNQNHPQHN